MPKKKAGRGPLLICVSGPGSTGKSETIREFTGQVFDMHKTRGDVLAVLRRPIKHYAIGITGSGDSVSFVDDGFRFLIQYHNLRVIVCAARSSGATMHAVQAWANHLNSALVIVPTRVLPAAQRAAAINANVRAIRRLLP